MKNNELYWEKRIANRTWSAYNDLEQKNRALLEMYQEASLSISDELYRLAEKMKTATPMLSDMHRYNRLIGLQKNMEKIIRELGEKAEKFGTDNMQQGFKETYSNVMVQLGKLEFDEVPQKVMQEMLDRPWQGSNFSKRLWKNTQTLATNLNDILTNGLTQGKTVTEMAIQLNNAMNKGFNVCHRLIRTETMHYLNESAFKGYVDAGCEEVEAWSAEDERVCPICGARHGKKYKINNRPILPFHAECRCTWLPVIDLDEKKEDNKDKIQFVEAKNLNGANAYAKSVLGIKNADYKGCDIVTANEWNKGLTDTFNRFPKLKDNFGFVGECKARNKAVKEVLTQEYLKSYKIYNPSRSIEELTELAKGKASSFIRRNLKVEKDTLAQSWSPQRDLLKEFSGVTVSKGVGKDSENFIDILKRNVDYKYHPEGCDTIRSVLDHEVGHQLDNLLDIRTIPDVQNIFDSRTKEEITRDISMYSWDNRNPNRYSEMIAEAWAEYCNNPKPREPAKKIGQIIEKEYKKKFGGK